MMRYFFAFILVLLMGFQVPKGKTTVYLIGDSTMANKDRKAFPETGWGMPFQIFFDTTVVIDNRAKNGRSTKSFIAENLWQPVINQLKEGDYVFIQFGHNDEVKEKVDRYTTPEEFMNNLTRYVNDARSKKANPVLLTPVTRRKFTNGKVEETHPEYSKLVVATAKKLNVPLIDLDTKSRELLQQIGEEPSKLLYLHLKPGEHPNYPDGKEDNTHFSELGARLMAQLVLDEIESQKLSLVDRIVKK